jgi:hypothetical protein
MSEFLALESEHGGDMWHFDLRFHNIIDINSNIKNYMLYLKFPE